jgi:hypothetical protein
VTILYSFQSTSGPDSIVGLKCDFPKAAWSAQYYARVEKELCDREIPFSAFDTKSASGVTEFLVIDLESDPDAAVKLVRLIFQDVFGFPANYVVNIHFRNISVRDEMISIVRDINGQGFLLTP